MWNSIWVWSSVLSCTYSLCVLDKLLNFSMSEFPYMSNDGILNLILSWNIKKLSHQNLAWSHCALLPLKSLYSQSILFTFVLFLLFLWFGNFMLMNHDIVFFFFFHLLFWALTRYLHSRIACTLLPRNFIFLIISSFPFSVFTLFIASYNRIRLLIFQKNFLLIFHLSMFIFSFAGRRGGRVGSCALALGSSWAGDHTQSTAVISLDP